MNGWKIITVAALAVISVALITAFAFANYNNGSGVVSPYGTYPNGPMGGHMGGPMHSGNPAYGNYPPTNGYPQNAYPYQYGMGGCHGRWGGNGFVGPLYPNNETYTSPITINTAVAIAKGYLTSLNNPDLAIDEVEEYTQNFYVSYYEKSTGIGAFEMLIDKYTGNIYPEMGPNMMWNTKYGMMRGGMMGGFWGTPSAVMPVTVDQAKTIAQQFLNSNLQGTTVGEVTAFYGYYRVEVLSSGNTYGMLSVNGYTGQVWYHTWHGTFIQEWEA